MPTPGTCPQGHRNDPAAAYCQECGAVIPSTPDISADATSPDYAASVMAMSSAGSDASMAAGGGRRRVLLVSGIAAVALVVVGGIAAAFMLIGGTEVPSVVGMTPAQAEQTLSDAGFTTSMGDKTFSDTVEKGQVESQEPAAGEKAGGGSAILLHLSRGPASIAPDLVGASISAARSEAKSADLELQETKEVSSTIAAGEIMSQDPLAGTELEAGDIVTVVVSSGPPSTTVTYTTDISAMTLRYDTTCSLQTTFWNITYPSSTLVNGSGERLSSASGDWRESPGNGTYIPCEIYATFPNVSTEEDSYQVWYDPVDHEDNHGPEFSRGQMELSGWDISSG